MNLKKSAVFTVVFISSLAISSCSSLKKKPPQDSESVESELPTIVERSPISKDPNLETVAIVGTNDIHGALAPLELKSRETNGRSTTYRSGGVAYLADYVRILRGELGSRLIWLDAGDEYQGSVESNADAGATMVKTLGAAGVTAAAIGNHEFDFGVESLEKRTREATFPYLAANIDSLGGTRPSMIYDTGRVRVGIIGMSTEETPRTTFPTNVKDLKFQSLKETALRESEKLRRNGADVVVLVAHAGLLCDLNHAPRGHALRKPSDLQGDCISEYEIPRLLKSVPSGTIDAVVSGHSHSIVHHWISGVPVIQSGANGRYFHVIYLTYDVRNKRLVPEQARIEGPVPVCPKIFENQGDCNGERAAPRGGRGALITPTFHGRKVESIDAVEDSYQPALAHAEKIKAEAVGKAARPIEIVRRGESPLGNLVADSIRDASGAELALMNSGGIRAPLEEGIITYGSVFRTIPFDNHVVVLDVTGAELRQILQVAESGARGFFPTSGLTLKLLDPDVDAPAKDLDGDKKIEPWEINRLIEAKLSDGSPIEDKTHYKLATPDFLVLGGDDLGWAMSRIPDERRHYTNVLIRDALIASVRKITADHGAVNTAGNPLIVSDSPRFIFEKKAPKTGKKRKARSHHRKQGKRANRVKTSTQ